MRKINIMINENKINIDRAFLDGLEYFGTLSDLFAPNKNKDFPEKLKEPLYLLFTYAKKRMKAAGRDRNLPEQLKSIKGLEDLTNCVSDTDEKHTIAVVDYASKIANQDLKKIDPDRSNSYFKMSFSGLKGYKIDDRKMLLSAAICHDYAYPITIGTEFRDKEIRVLHQNNAAQEFKKFAEEINKKFTFLSERLYQSDLMYEFKRKSINIKFYQPDELEGTAYMISLHDSPPFNSLDKYIELLISHREADRLWMLDRAGFALDILRKIIKSNGKEYSPLEMLSHNVARHIEEARNYSEKDREIIGFKTFTNYLNGDSYSTLYMTDIGFQIFKDSLEKRMQEYKISEKAFFETLSKRLTKGEKNG